MLATIQDHDYATWDQFKSDPIKWFMLHPAEAEAVWRAIAMHKPSSQMSEPPLAADNIVEFPSQKRGK